MIRGRRRLFASSANFHQSRTWPSLDKRPRQNIVGVDQLVPGREGGVALKRVYLTQVARLGRLLTLRSSISRPSPPNSHLLSLPRAVSSIAPFSSSDLPCLPLPAACLPLQSRSSNTPLEASIPTAPASWPPQATPRRSGPSCSRSADAEVRRLALQAVPATGCRAHSPASEHI